MDRTKWETVLDVKWAALNQPGGENKSCTEAVLGVASLWTLRNCCCRQFEAVHFFLRFDPKSNAKATRPGAKPVCGLGTKLCSPLAVRIAVVLPEYTGATLQHFLTRTHRPNKCLVMPMWKGSYCKFMQVHAQLHLRGLAIDWKYCIWPKLNDNNQTKRTDLVKHLAFTNVLT